MQDQRQLWDNAHTNLGLHVHSLRQTQFAEEVEATIPKASTILELGCGEGNDSAYFAKQGHAVVATDFSDVVIEQNHERWSQTNLLFKVQDTSEHLQYDDNSFGVVYARLSLHYSTDEITQKIFAEINRVLKPDGYLCFICKEVSDAIYGKGTQIESDMFELDGHVRHFFSEVYARKLLSDIGFRIESLTKGQEKIYERQSAFIKIIARK